ncbi:hypothetical protein BK654_13495 [Pseudomonas brassicacearum]|nr:hypothetical protein BK654_13495 [Pseudomonas brassicacearum]
MQNADQQDNKICDLFGAAIASKLAPTKAMHNLWSELARDEALQIDKGAPASRSPLPGASHSNETFAAPYSQ